MNGPTDIGWKQFSIKVMDIVRWPAVVLIVAFVMRGPFERLIDAIAVALRG